MKSGDQFPSPTDLKTLLFSADNKIRLHNLIKTALRTKAPIINKEIIYSVGTVCTNLTTGNVMGDQCFNQTETDTMQYYFQHTAS